MRTSAFSPSGGRAGEGARLRVARHTRTRGIRRTAGSREQPAVVEAEAVRRRDAGRLVHYPTTPDRPDPDPPAPPSAPRPSRARATAPPAPWTVHSACRTLGGPIEIPIPPGGKPLLYHHSPEYTGNGGVSHPRLRASSDHGALRIGSLCCLARCAVPPVSGYFTTSIVTMTAISTIANVESMIVWFLPTGAGCPNASGCAMLGSTPRISG